MNKTVWNTIKKEGVVHTFAFLKGNVVIDIIALSDVIDVIVSNNSNNNTYRIGYVIDNDMFIESYKEI